MSLKYILLFAAALALTACQSTSTVNAESSSDAPDFSGPSVRDAATYQTESDAFKVLGEPEVNGTTLTLTVQYSGGCKDHDWQLVTNGILMKSLPPQMPLKVMHQANNDLCKKLIQDTLRFDLQPLSPPGGGAVRLNLLADREFALECVFESNR